jgi:hypothetical protein
MEDEQGTASFQDMQNLIHAMGDKDYRAAFVEQFNHQLLARQMRGFRGSQSQVEYGEKIGKSQTQIARFEDPLYGWQMRTAFEIARKEDVAVIMCFVDHETFLRFEQVSKDLLTPEPFDADRLNALFVKAATESVDRVKESAERATESPTAETVTAETAPTLLSKLNSIGYEPPSGLVGANLISPANYQTDIAPMIQTFGASPQQAGSLLVNARAL